MSISIKAFLTMDEYVSNHDHQVAPFGELSTWSLTYAIEKKEYHNPLVPGNKLFVFSAKDDVTGAAYTLPQSLVNQTISIAKQCVVYSSLNVQPLSKIALRNHLVSYFNNPDVQIASLEMGPFVSNGPLAVPQWVSWVSVNNSNVFVKVWLSDEAFIDQYEKFEIKIIPPILPLDNFFQTYQNVLLQVNSRTQNILSNQIQNVRDRYPETYLRLYDFDWVDQIDPSRKITTTWGVLIYSKAGDNVDSIKDAIIDYIANNSTRSVADWTNLFPSIYTRTEFTVLPRWDLVSIPNLSNFSVLYSSILDPNEVLQFATNAIGYYPPTHVSTKVKILPLDYKALSLLFVPGTTNVTGKQKIEDIFPDYIAVPSTSTDFGRMQLNTRSWVNFILELVITAETANRNSSMPIHLRRIIRDNKVFIASVFDNVHYLVAAKSNDIYL